VRRFDSCRGHRVQSRGIPASDAALRRFKDPSVHPPKTAGDRLNQLLNARWDAGSTDRFVARMNATGRSLGMTHTRNTDPSGYDDATVSTAADQVRLVDLLGQPGYDRVAAGLMGAAAMVDRIAGHRAVPDSPQLTPAPGTRGASQRGGHGRKRALRHRRLPAARLFGSTRTPRSRSDSDSMSAAASWGAAIRSRRPSAVGHRW
jgi:hypothetical protein